MILVASDTQTLLIYENTTLKWAAQLPMKPVSIKRGSYKQTALTNDLHRSMLTFSSNKGELFIAYLGTNPSLFSAPPPLARDVNYEETDREMLELTDKIKAAQSNSKHRRHTIL
jgi:Bardet-Biedl syndrome 9 protein